MFAATPGCDSFSPLASPGAFFFAGVSDRVGSSPSASVEVKVIPEATTAAANAAATVLLRVLMLIFLSSLVVDAD
jgi:hypothetical protein